MKKVIILALLFGGLTSNAQYNLQFNRVKTLTGETSPNQESNIDTVPPGKVWKIEALGFSSDQLNFAYTINGKVYNNYKVFTTNGAPVSVATISSDVLWLKSGDIIGVKNYASGTGSCCFRQYVMSIIEFNLTQ